MAWELDGSQEMEKYRALRYGGRRLFFAFTIIVFLVCLTCFASFALEKVKGSPSSDIFFILMDMIIVFEARSLLLHNHGGHQEATTVRQWLREYWQRNIWAYNAIIYRVPSKNKMVIVHVHRGEGTRAFLRNNSILLDQPAFIVPLGGWFAKPYLAGSDAWKYRVFHFQWIWREIPLSPDQWIVRLIDQEGGRIQLRVAEVLPFLLSGERKSIVGTWKDMHNKIAYLLGEVARKHAHASAIGIECGRDASALALRIDEAISRIDSSDRLPGTKEGKAVRKILANALLATLSEDDPRRAILENPSRRGRRERKKGASDNANPIRV